MPYNLPRGEVRFRGAARPPQVPGAAFEWVSFGKPRQPDSEPNAEQKPSTLPLLGSVWQVAGAAPGSADEPLDRAEHSSSVGWV